MPGGPGGKTVGALRGTPGKVVWAGLGLDPVRGMLEFGGDLYAANGSDITRITTAPATATVTGTLNTTTGRVSMAHNGQVLCLVDGRDGWLLTPDGTAVGAQQWAPHAVTLGEYVRPTPNNATGFVYECTDVGTGYSYPPEPTWPTVAGNTVVQPNGGPTWTCRAQSFQRITDADFPSATQVVFLGGYFVFDDPSVPGRFMVSSLYATSGATFNDALDFATAEADPDGLVRIFALRGLLWLLGESTTEVWYHAGGAFPFAPDQSLHMERGCAAKWSAANVGEALFWLARDRQGRVQVVASTGGPAEVISTPALEYEIGRYSDVSDAVGYAYHDEGHTFYVLTFPTGNATWVFDLTMGLWHRRARWSGGAWQRDNYETYARFAGKHLVGHRSLGDIAEMTQDAFTEDDNGTLYPIRRERVAPVVHAEGRRVFFGALEIDMQLGAGVLATADPKVKLDWSDDGGRTWAPASPMEIDMPVDGTFGGRVVFRRLGMSRHRNFRLVIEDEAVVVTGSEGPDVTVMGAYLKAEAGES